MEERNNGSEHLMGDEDVDVSREVNSILDDLGLNKQSIKNRRQFIEMLNIVQHIPIRTTLDNCIAYVSGSTAEGVASFLDQHSDIDVMYIHPFNVIASQRQNQENTFRTEYGVYVIENSISHPLFKRLRNVNRLYSKYHYQHCNGHTYLAHTEIKRTGIQRMNETDSSYFVNELYTQEGLPNVFPRITTGICGPSIATSARVNTCPRTIDCDSVLAVFSQSWPNDIDEWFIRDRYKHWPSPRDIQIIKDGGCHLVGKGFDESSEYDIEWRMSFSMAENILIHTFNNTQMKCYYLMKALLKRKVKPQFPNLMCSYHVKTVMFWVCEETGVSFFKKDSLLRCFEFCIRKLCGFMYNGHLPCYFMPNTNLLSYQGDQHRFKEISDYLLQFTQRNKFVSFYSDLKSSYLEFNHPEYIFHHTCLSYQFRLCMSDNVNTLERKTTAEIQSFFLRAIFDITDKCLFHGYRNDNILRILCQKIFPDLSSVCLSALMKEKGRNKIYYKRERQYLKFMTNELAVECSQGLLKRATVYYKTGKFTECMVLARNVLEKLLEKNVLVIGSHLVEMVNFFFQFFFKHNFRSDARFRITAEVRFSPLERSILPDFLLTEMDLDEELSAGVSTSGWVFIDPIVYAYGLAIVCQHEISDFNTRDQFLQELREYFVKHKLEVIYQNTAKRVIDILNVKCNII